MKRIALVSALLLSAFLAESKDLTVQWVNNPPGEQITSYAIYSSTNNSAFSLMSVTPGTSFVVSNITPALYQFQVRARNLWGEGPSSNTASTPSGLPTSTISVSVTISP